MRKNSSVTTLTIFFLCFTFFGFKLGSAEAEERFKVGVIIPMTGGLADYGTSIRPGFELAMSESPEQFSKVDFIFEDSAYDANMAVSAFQKLRTVNKVDMFYAWGVSPTEALIPIAEANKLPLLVETTLKESVSNKKYVVRAARTGERIARALADEISQRKIKKVSLIVTDLPFYDDIVKHMKVLLPEKGIEITRIRAVLPTENDVRSYILELRKQEEDAIGVFLLPAQIISFYRRVAEMKLTPTTFSADIIGSESIIKDCPDTVTALFLPKWE